MAEERRIVILGGGIGGLGVARGLVRRGVVKGKSVTVIDERASHVYTPWLYEVASGDIAARLAKNERARFRSSADFLFAKLSGYAGVHFRHATVATVDAKTRHVVLGDGNTVPYDELVIALGSTTNTYGIPGVAEHTIPLRTVRDANAIRERVVSLLREREQGAEATVVIAGAGANGVELAAELAVVFRRAHPSKRKVLFRLVLLDAGGEVLTILPRPLRLRARRRLEHLGVELALGTALVEAKKGSILVRPTKDVKAPKRSIRADLCVWSGGVAMPDVVCKTAFAKDDHGRIRVDDTFRTTSDLRVFALGDCASLLNPVTNRPEIQNASIAVREADVVAENIVRTIAHKPLRRHHFRAHDDILVALGGHDAVGVVFTFRVRGIVAYVLRRLVDLDYFRRIMPLRAAMTAWVTGLFLYRKNEKG